MEKEIRVQLKKISIAQMKYVSAHKILVIFDEKPILAIKGKLFVFAILINGALYEFDVREIANITGDSDMMQSRSDIIRNRAKWISMFFEHLKEKNFLINFGEG